MIPAAPTRDESQRLKALDDYCVLDTLPEQALDDLTALAAQICEAPIAAISLIDKHRQWFKGKIGIDFVETPREISFCGHAIHQRDLFEVPDAALDERFTDNPLVTGDPGIRFYAGAPLVSPEDRALGALCVMDSVPRTLTEEQGQALRVLARQVMAHLELLHQTRRLVTVITEQKKEAMAAQRLAAIVESSEDAIIGKDLNGIVTSWNKGAEKIFGYAAAEMEGISITRLIPSARQGEEEMILGKIRSGQRVEHFETLRVTKDGRLIQVSVSASPIKDTTGKVIGASKIARDITDRIQARKALEKERDFIFAVVDTVGALVVVLDPQARIVRFNRACEQLTGYAFGEVKGRDVMDLLLLPEERMAARAEFGNLSAGRFPNTFENHWVTRDGIPRLIAWSNTALVGANGLVEHVIATGLDISEKRQAERALVESERKFRTLFDVASDAIYMLHDDLFVDCNAKGLELFGLTREQLIGQAPFFNSPATQPDGRNSQEKVFGLLRSAEEGKPQLFEWMLCKPDGTPVYAEVNLSRLELGGKIYIQAIVRDVTDRKRAEEKIAEQAALLDKARDAILVRDLEGNVLFWNDGAERIYGWRREDVLGQNVRGLFYIDVKIFDEANSKAISEGSWNGELRQQTMDRGEITVEARWTLIRDNEGRPKSVLAINTDITDRKKIEAQFLRAQRMESIGTLAGGVAHDLNNILAPIMMAIEILKITATDSQAQAILETIEVSARRGSDIVRQVLSFARGMEGKRVEVQPKHLLNDIENIIRDTFPRDIRLRFAIPTDTWTILGDPTQMHQILLNLCVNARDAMPNGGSLTVDVENCLLDEHYAAMHIEAKPGRYVIIRVSDSGTGIPPAILVKIFEPFFTTKDLNKGTGLGLSTVMAIVKSHEGFVNVYSEPGKGTTFKVYLPASEVSSEGRNELSEEDSLPRGNGETVLVVDDEASVRSITSQTLEAFGYRVFTATDGADAVAIYAQRREEIAVVLTDMMMPIMDGPTTINALMRVNPSVKIIAASGLSTNSRVALVSGAEIKYFLAKPYTAATLLKTLHTILEEN